jgi:hypothetical protein
VLVAISKEILEFICLSTSIPAIGAMGYSGNCVSFKGLSNLLLYGQPTPRNVTRETNLTLSNMGQRLKV